MSSFGSFGISSGSVGPGVGANPASARPIASDADAAVQTFALMMAEHMLFDPASSPTQGIAKKMPGASENVTAQMQALREESQVTADRREMSKKMSQKDEAMNYRA